MQKITIVVPEHPTVGDVIKALFPDMEFRLKGLSGIYANYFDDIRIKQSLWVEDFEIPKQPDDDWKAHHCRECAYLTDEKHIVGNKCIRPGWFWRTQTSMYKQPYGQACKGFKPKED